MSCESPWVVGHSAGVDDDWRRQAQLLKQIYSWLRCTGSVPKAGDAEARHRNSGAVTAVIPEPYFKKGTRVGALPRVRCARCWFEDSPCFPERRARSRVGPEAPLKAPGKEERGERALMG